MRTSLYGYKALTWIISMGEWEARIGLYLDMSEREVMGLLDNSMRVYVPWSTLEQFFPSNNSVWLFASLFSLCNPVG